MRILLTGAEGFTGQHFAALARQSGHDVSALKADLTQSEALRAEVLAINPDYVLHLAAISFVGHADMKAFYEVNLFGTINLLNAVVELPVSPRAIVLASSANVYGNCHTSPISECQTPFPNNHYGISKLAMEHAARTYADRLHIVVARPFNYTGPEQDLTFVVPKIIDHFNRRAAEIRLGDLGVKREFNDVLFVCAAYLQLLARGAAGQTYNLCSGQPYTLQQVIDTLTRITGHAINVKVDPAFVRTNEVQSLCGNPDRLQSLLSAGERIKSPTLEETLQRMLAAAKH